MSKNRPPEGDKSSLDVLLAKSIDGTDADFQAFFREVYSPMLSLAMRLLGRREDAEEAIQEAFLRIYKNRKQYDPSRRALPWVFRILSNEAHRLGGRRTGHVTLDEGLVKDGPPGLLPEEKVRFWQDLYQTLDEMGEAARTAFVLREFEGWLDRDIALVLDIAEVTVRRHVMEARKRLRVALADYRQK